MSTTEITEEFLDSLVEKHYPRREPTVQRNPNWYGDDPWVDERTDERDAIFGFIELLVEENIISKSLEVSVEYP